MKIRRKIKDDTSKRKGITTRFQFIGIGIGIFYWFIESVIDTFIFHRGNLVWQLFPKDSERLLMRLLIISLFAIFGFYAQVIINKGDKLYKSLRKLNEELEYRSIELTGQLKDANKAIEYNKIKQEQAERRLVFQNAINRILAEPSPFSETASKVIQGICESWGWVLGEFWVLDRQANVLRYLEIRNSLPVDFSEFEKSTRQFTFGFGAGLPGRIWATGEPAWIVDVTKDTNFLRGDYATKVGLHSAFGFPILSGNEVLGAMIFFSREIRQPDADQLHMFKVIGNQVGLFMEHKQ